MTNKNARFVTIKEAAEILHLHPYSIRRLIWRRKLPHLKVVDKILIPLSALEELETQSYKGTAMERNRRIKQQ